MSTQTQTQNAAGAAAAVSPSLLDEILSEAKIKPKDEGYDIARRGVEAFIAEMLAPNRSEERIDKALVDAMIAEIDKRLSSQVNEIMHHEEVQKLESSWRSLKFLVDRVDFRENIRVEMLNVSKGDLLKDFEDSPEVVKSGLYRLVYSNEYGVFGGKPYGLLLGNYDFGPGPTTATARGEPSTSRAIAATSSTVTARRASTSSSTGTTRPSALISPPRRPRRLPVSSRPRTREPVR